MADFPITAPRSRVTPLLNPERHGGFTHKWTIPYTDVAQASATGSTDTVTITLGNTPAKWIATNALANVTTAFAGTGGLTVQVGFGSNTTAALAAGSVLSAGTIGVAGTPVASFANSTGTSTSTIKAVFTNSTSGSPSAVTAGSVDIFLKLLDTTKLG